MSDNIFDTIDNFGASSDEMFDEFKGLEHHSERLEFINSMKINYLDLMMDKENLLPQNKHYFTNELYFLDEVPKLKERIQKLYRNDIGIDHEELDTNIPDIIEGIIPSDSLGEIYGKSGTNKTFLVLEMLYCISTGISYHGHKVEQGEVFYVVGEGLKGLRRRLDALEKKYGRKSKINLLKPTDLGDEKKMKKIAEYLATFGSIKLLVIDTLNRNTPSIEENSATHWAKVLEMFDTYMKPFVSTIIYIHHSGTNGQGSRGTSAREGSADFIYNVKLDAKKHETVLVNTKMKDDEKIPPIYYKMEKFVNSLVPKMQSKQNNNLTPTEQKVYGAISEYEEITEKQFDDIVYSVIDPNNTKKANTNNKSKNRIKAKLESLKLLPKIIKAL